MWLVGRKRRRERREAERLKALDAVVEKMVEPDAFLTGNFSPFAVGDRPPLEAVTDENFEPEEVVEAAYSALFGKKSP